MLISVHLVQTSRILHNGAHSAEGGISTEI